MPGKWFQKWWLVMFWPALVIAALNIENVATKFGADKLLETQWPLVTSVFGLILSDNAFHIALFGIGGGAFAWGQSWITKREGREPTLERTGEDCSALADKLKGLTFRSGTRLESDITRLNHRLRELEITAAPIPDMSSKFSRLHVAKYLDFIGIFLQGDDLVAAKDGERVYLRNLARIGFKPRPASDADLVQQP